MNKQVIQHSHIMEYYLEMKGGKLLIHTTWTEWKIPMLSERRQKGAHAIYDSIYIKIQKTQTNQ